MATSVEPLARMAFDACNSVVDDTGDVDDAISATAAGLIIHAFIHDVDAESVAGYLKSVANKSFDAVAAAKALVDAEEINFDPYSDESDDDLVLDLEVLRPRDRGLDSDRRQLDA